jgi:hypothetical protein
MNLAGLSSFYLSQRLHITHFDKFYFLTCVVNVGNYSEYEKKINLEILTDLHVLSSPKIQQVIPGIFCVNMDMNLTEDLILD